MTDELAKRKLSLPKRVDLSDFADGWDGAYAIVLLASGRDLIEVADIASKDMTKVDQYKYEVSVVRDHFVEGKVWVLDDRGEKRLADMEPDDIEGAAMLADRLYAAIMGVDLDPKDLLRAVASNSESSNDSNITTTPLSTESQPAPPQAS